MNKRIPRILAIDDDQGNGDIIREMAEGKYCVQVITEAQNALRETILFKPDIILLDIMMPGMNGFEVCKELKMHKEFRFTKIIFVTAKAYLPDRLRGYAVGADAYVTKPYDAEELDAMIRVFLRLQHTEEVNTILAGFMRLFSNETRNPLNGIMGFAQLLLQSTTLSKEDHEYAMLLMTSAQSLVRFVKKIQMLSDLRMNYDIARNPGSLKDLVTNVVEQQRYTVFQQKMQSVSLNFTQEHQDLLLNKESIAIAFELLCEAMSSAAPSGTEIHVSGYNTSEHRIIHIENIDKLITEDKVPCLVNEYTINDALVFASSETLNLIISKLIIELHGGELKCEEKDKGMVRFMVSLPL